MMIWTHLLTHANAQNHIYHRLNLFLDTFLPTWYLQEHGLGPTSHQSHKLQNLQIPGKHCDVAHSSQVTFDLTQFTVRSVFIRLE